MIEIKDIAIIFMAIILEAIPFLLLGGFLASLIEVFVSEEVFVKLIPKNKFLSSLVGLFLGFLIPVCDCAVIPVSKKLIKKGVPLNVAITFMLSSPIINPVVLFATYYAFSGVNMQLFWYRLIGGVIISMVIGLIMNVFNSKDVLIEKEGDDECGCSCGHHHHHHHEEHEHECNHEEHEHECNHEHHHHEVGHNKYNRIVDILVHTTKDFLDVFTFLIIGALIASISQVLVPQEVWNYFNSNVVVSIIAMMLFAYLISLCSTSDSFVGKSLLANFGDGAVLGFLIVGPMIDVKNTLVLMGNYKKKFVFTLISLIFVFTLIYCLGVMFL